MATRRVRVRRPGSEVGSGREAEALFGQSSDGFTLTFSGGRGILLSEGEKLFGSVTIDRMEMAIPKISFPFDVSAGIRGLRNRRHELAALKLCVSLDDLEQKIRGRAAGSQWIANPAVGFERGYASVLVEYGPPGQRFHASFRLLPVVKGDAPALLVDEPRAYGPLPAGLIHVTASSLEAMIGARPEGLGLAPRDLVKKVLFASLPKKGWRVPDFQGVKLVGLELTADKALIEYRHPDFSEGAPKIDEGADRSQLSWMLKMEESLLVRDGDALFASGNTEGARSIYARLLDQEPDNPVVAARLAMVDVLNPHMRETALSLASESVARHPGRTDLAAVMAHGFALKGDVEAEIGALCILMESGCSLERLGAGLRCGRLMLGSDPHRAIDFLEKALAARREDRGALAALMEACVALKETDRLSGLIPRWIAAHKSQSERSAAHISVGRMLLDRLDDPKGAVHHFERAALADPDSRDAAWGLAESLAKSNNAKRALLTFERMERLCRDSGDLAGAAKACASIGEIWLDLGEPAPAAARFREAMQLCPDDPALRVLMARALTSTGRKAEAAVQLEIALRKDGPECKDEWWGRSALDLASLYLDLDEIQSAEHWIELSQKRSDTRERAQKMRIELVARQQGSKPIATERREYRDFRDALRDAEAALKIGYFESALAAANAAGSGPIELRGRSAEVAAMALVALDRPDEAVSILERVADNLEPHEAAGIHTLAAKIRSGRLGDAKVTFGEGDRKQAIDLAELLRSKRREKR